MPIRPVRSIHSIHSIHSIRPIRPIHHIPINLTTNPPIFTHRPCHPTLMVRLTKQRTLIKLLRRRRNVNRRVPVEEIDGLERDLDDFARHDGKVFDAGDL